METDEFGIPIIPCDTAKEFLDELDELNPRWNEGRWIYRGQNDADWKLLPRTMRPSFFQTFVWDFILGDDENAMIQGEFTQVRKSEYLVEHPCYRITMHALTEMRLIQTFIELADRAGLPIPYERVDKAELFMDMMKMADDIAEDNFDPDLLRIRISENSINYALAQHHRVPTRLLDFTHRSLIAAFFAGAIETKLETAPSRCAVYAIDVDRLKRTSLRLVRHRMSQIGFLQAQHGLFLYDSQADSKWLDGDHVHWEPYDSELRKMAPTGVYKICLRFTECEELLDQLRKKGIAKPFLMPSYDNVAEAICENLSLWSEFVE